MMSKEELSLIYKVTNSLKRFNHPDADRIAKEICEFSKYDSELVESIISKLKLNKPWEYIKGYTEFDGNTLLVTKDTLIPRLESLQIIDICNSYSGFTKIVDVGCGSGAIGISLAKRLPKIKVVLTDNSEKALEIAKKNIILNKVNNVEVFRSNLLENIDLESKALIVANLPYIPTEEYNTLDKSVKNYEPRAALDGGEFGLDLIIPLLKEIVKRKIKYSVFEIDPSQEEKLISFATDTRFKYEFIKDFRGLIRFFKFYL